MSLGDVGLKGEQFIITELLRAFSILTYSITLQDKEYSSRVHQISLRKELFEHLLKHFSLNHHPRKY